MAKNVTEFQHFLKHNWITEMDLEWVAKLRREDEIYKVDLNKINKSVPRVADIFTETSKKKKIISDINYSGNMNPICTLDTTKFIFQS